MSKTEKLSPNPESFFYVFINLFFSIISKMTDVKANDIEEPWQFYIIQNKGCTYAGVSPDPVKRLRKHNGEISGGAKYTTGKGPGWTHVCLVSGFQTKTQSLQFEWAVKHVPPRNAGGLIHRLKKLYCVLNKLNWTSKAPLATTIPLTLQWKIEKPDDLKADALPVYVTEQQTM
jgi:predicted GIY-YIG superfamily endonuclease